MDIKRIEYNKKLMDNKFKFSKDVETEIRMEQFTCNHLKLITTCDNYEHQIPSYSDGYCLLCGKDLSDIRGGIPVIDGTYYKVEDNLTSLEKLNEIRDIIIKIGTENPKITNKEMVERVQQQVDENSTFLNSEKGYNRAMLVYRKATNRHL